MRVRFVEEAVEELRGAATWYESKQPGLGLLFVQRVDHAVDKAATRPLSFPLWSPQRSYRRALTEQFPYAVVFMPIGETLRVIAVAHMRRKPGYWRSR